jgi:hypothetical protein
MCHPGLPLPDHRATIAGAFAPISAAPPRHDPTGAFQVEGIQRRQHGAVLARREQQDQITVAILTPKRIKAIGNVGIPCIGPIIIFPLQGRTVRHCCSFFPVHVSMNDPHYLNSRFLMSTPGKISSGNQKPVKTP